MTPGAWQFPIRPYVLWTFHLELITAQCNGALQNTTAAVLAPSVCVLIASSTVLCLCSFKVTMSALSTFYKSMYLEAIAELHYNKHDDVIHAYVSKACVLSK